MKKFYLIISILIILFCSFVVFYVAEKNKQEQEEHEQFIYALTNMEKIYSSIPPLPLPQQKAFLWHIYAKNSKPALEKMIWYYTLYADIDKSKELLEKVKVQYNEEDYFDFLILMFNLWDKPISENNRKTLDENILRVKSDTVLLKKICFSLVFNFSIIEREDNPQYQRNINAGDIFFKDLIKMCQENKFNKDFSLGARLFN